MYTDGLKSMTEHRYKKKLQHLIFNEYFIHFFQTKHIEKYFYFFGWELLGFIWLARLSMLDSAPLYPESLPGPDDGWLGLP